MWFNIFLEFYGYGWELWLFMDHAYVWPLLVRSKLVLKNSGSESCEGHPIRTNNIITCLVLISTGSSVNKLSKLDTSTSEVRSGTNGGGLSCLDTASQFVPSKNTWFLTWSAPSWPKRSSGSFSSNDNIISFVAGVVPLGAYRKSTSLCKILEKDFKI